MKWKNDMTAAKLNIRWDETSETIIPARPGHIETEESRRASDYTRQIVCDSLALRCTHCDSIVYSRRSQWCGACGEKLPKQFQFSPSEAQRIENLLRVERERFRKWRERVFDQAFD